MPDKKSYKIRSDLTDFFTKANISVSEEDSIKKYTKIAETYFGDNLLLGVIEFVTLSTINSVGDTSYICSRCVADSIDEIHTDYVDVIAGLHKFGLGSISKYYSWYQRNTYYYAEGSNEVEIENIAVRDEKTIQNLDEPDADDYILDYSKTLEDTDCKRFFQNYLALLQTKDWFKKLPVYYVLAKPISLKEKDYDHIPLGNLYTILGFEKEVERAEFENFISKIQLEWFALNGAKLLKEYSRKKISDEYIPNYNFEPGKNVAFVKKISKNIIIKNDNKNYTFEDLCKIVFDGSDFINLLKEDYLLNINSEFTKRLIQYSDDASKIKEEIEKLYSRGDAINYLDTRYQGLVNKRVIDEDTIKYFLRFLSKRRIALMLQLVFDYDIPKIHSLITFGDSDTKSSKPKSYLQTNQLFLSDLDKNYLSLSMKECMFLRKVCDEIRDRYREKGSIFSCGFVRLDRKYRKKT